MLEREFKSISAQKEGGDEKRHRELAAVEAREKVHTSYSERKGGKEKRCCSSKGHLTPERKENSGFGVTTGGGHIRGKKPPIVFLQRKKK